MFVSGVEFGGVRVSAMQVAEAASVRRRAGGRHGRWSKEAHQQHREQGSGSQAMLQSRPQFSTSIGQRGGGKQESGGDSKDASATSAERTGAGARTGASAPDLGGGDGTLPPTLTVLGF